MFYARFKKEEHGDATRKINGKTEFNPEYVHWLEDQLKFKGDCLDKAEILLDKVFNMER